MSSDLDDNFWEDLLTLIEEGKVIPVIGAGVVTRGEDQTFFYPWLAARLAERLGIPVETPTAALNLNEVATAHLLNRGESNVLYTRIARILRDECPAPGQALLDLASISAFNLYLTTTFDPLLQRALDAVRNGGAGPTSVLAFSPGADARDLPARRRDLRGTTVFHLLGRVSSMPEYVVWEGDMLEFILDLNRHMPVMERLARDLKEHGLLVLGLHFSDWLVRFFLRVSKQEPFSTPRVHRAYLADEPADFAPQSLVLFFGAVSRDIHVMRQDPVTFCSELARRWKARHPAEDRSGSRRWLPPSTPEMPRGAIFVSYASEDEAAAAAVVRGLQAAGCTVWYDRERLQAGQHWRNSLEDDVKSRCGLFLSLISRTTEAARESYYHLERNWAATRSERMAHDEEFYIPVVIDDAPLSIGREPRPFHHIQATRLPGGATTPEFAERLLGLQRKATSAPP
jgi:hypothetical protein